MYNKKFYKVIPELMSSTARYNVKYINNNIQIKTNETFKIIINI